MSTDPQPDLTPELATEETLSPEVEPQASQTTTTTPDGKWAVTTTTTFTEIPSGGGGGGGGASIVIPANAKTTGILDNYANWKQEKDAGTPGSASNMFNKYIGVNEGRQFHADQKDHGGVRWSTSPVKDAAATNFVYALYVKMTDPTQVGQLELDVNQVLADERNVFLCTQANFKKGVWDYTLTPGGSCHWYPSNIKLNPADWKAGVWNHIRIWTTHDSTGVVTYKVIEINGMGTAFASTCKGVSAFKPTPVWPVGLIINNYQTNGANTGGTMDTFAKQMQVIYW